MTKDKYTAVWVSHSSISDFIKCPRAYYLNNVYKDPQTGHKINLMSPPLALGQAVHEVLESLSLIESEKRLLEPLAPKLNDAWKKISGKRGGFPNDEVEENYKNRAKEMIKRVVNNPGPLLNLAVKIKMDLPYYWLSEEENIILCGKIDWIEYIKQSNSVHIIDFKTGTRDEDAESLQLPIYHLLVHNCQERKVSKASYWYLDRNKSPVEQPLPDLDKAREKVFNLAKKIKLARQFNRFVCPQKKGCSSCRPLEAVLRGEAEFVGTDEYKQDVYIFAQKNMDDVESVIL